MRNLLIVLGVTTLASVGLGAAPASAVTAGTVSAVGNTAQFTAGEGQFNEVVVTETADSTGLNRLYIFNDILPIVPGQNCFQPDAADPTVAACHIDDFGDIPSVHVDAGNGDDDIVIRTRGIGTVDAGYGDDSVSGNATFHDTYGGPGNDILTGGFVQHGGTGNDTIIPAVDGFAYGDDGNDTLIGHAGGETLYGGPGNDIIQGQDGDDLIFGESGEDEIAGGRGNDEIHGGDDADIIFGNSGDDRLYGDGGVDEISGGAGTNVIRQD